jgi:hypothetical protein
MATERDGRVHLINSIRVDPSKAERYPELERDIRGQLTSSTRQFEKLKTTISNLVRFTTDVRGFTDVDLLEEKAGRIRPNMDVVRSLRLTKYILCTLIYLTRGDARFVENMKPGQAFYEKHPRLAEAVKTGTDVDPVLLALYNESPHKFIADYDPQYAIPALLGDILGGRSKRGSSVASHFHRTHGRQFEESMLLLTAAVLRLLFNVEEVDTDMDIMLYLAKSRGKKPVRLKRVFEDDVKKVHAKIDHSLFLLKEAARYVLEETRKDSSFIQQVLNQSYVVSVLESSRGVMKSLDHLDSVLAAMGRLKADAIRLCRSIADHTKEGTQGLNAMMDSGAYRELLLLSRDMVESGSRFFSLLQSVFGYYADLAIRYRIGMQELLERLERSLTSHFLTISKYLQLTPGVEKRLDSFRRNYGTLTLVGEGRSELHRTILHEVSQVAVNFTTSTERGKLFRRHVTAYEEFDLLYDPLYGDKIASITDPIISMRESFPAASKYCLTRYTGKGEPDPDAVRNCYRRMLRIGLASGAILDFYGNLLEDGRYMFDLSTVRQESADARQHLKAIMGYAKDYLRAHGRGDSESQGRGSTA